MRKITGQINNNIQNINEISSKQQCKCLSCGKPEYYKKRYPNNKE
jgi:hypothetical protein